MTKSSLEGTLDVDGLETYNQWRHQAGVEKRKKPAITLLQRMARTDYINRYWDEGRECWSTMRTYIVVYPLVPVTFLSHLWKNYQRSILYFGFQTGSIKAIRPVYFAIFGNTRVTENSQNAKIALNTIFEKGYTRGLFQECRLPFLHQFAKVFIGDQSTNSRRVISEEILQVPTPDRRKHHET